jgi:hypothetical protein
MDAPLHPLCEPIAFLLGTWSGEGKGVYPTITDFGYREESRFWHIGKPFLAYQQRTWSLADGSPLHTEMGYWRCKEDGVLEVVLAHALGLAEIEEGRVDGNRIEISSVQTGRASTAKAMDSITRTFEVNGNVLTYEMSMAAVGMPLQNHLTAELHRTTA